MDLPAVSGNSTYAEVVMRSAQNYTAQLESISGTDAAVAALLRDLYLKAIQGMDEQAVWSQLQQTAPALLQVENRLAFCNECSVGIGNPQAHIVFVGQEWAFDVDSEFGHFSF